MASGPPAGGPAVGEPPAGGPAAAARLRKVRRNKDLRNAAFLVEVGTLTPDFWMGRGRKGTMAEKRAAGGDSVVIKKYANRRLYNTATSSYVTLDDLCQMVKDGTDFVVYDAKTGEDITRSVLTQIIVGEEGKGQNLLPINFLRQLIGWYGDSLQDLVPRYLDHSMQAFARNQEQMREYMQKALDGFCPFSQFEQMGKGNMAGLEPAMKMASSPHPGEAPRAAANGEKAEGDGKDELEELKDRIDALQKQLDELTRGSRR